MKYVDAADVTTCHWDILLSLLIQRPHFISIRRPIPTFPSSSALLHFELRDAFTSFVKHSLCILQNSLRFVIRDSGQRTHRNRNFLPMDNCFSILYLTGTWGKKKFRFWKIEIRSYERVWQWILLIIIIITIFSLHLQFVDSPHFQSNIQFLTQ